MKEFGLPSSGIGFVPNFVKIYKIVQKFQFGNTFLWRKLRIVMKFESICQQFSNFLNIFPHFVMT
jgi:hypothetical protein